MNYSRWNIASLIFLISLLASCSDNGIKEQEDQNHSQHRQDSNGQMVKVMHQVHLSEMQFNSLDFRIDSIPRHPLKNMVEANGHLEVPPQHEATVTSFVGANVESIKVIEGEEVKKGQVLIYLTHPDLIKLQTAYVKTYHRLNYLEQELNRQEKLYEKQVGSGKTYQKTLADVRSMRSELRGYASRLRQLKMDVERIKKGELYQRIPVVSPIDGYIEKVLVQLGQYVNPNRELFKIVNNEHVHADLMVFEKDVPKVREGQKVYFTVESVPGETLTATIYSVGKKFEQNPKAIHVHSDIDSKKGYLIPGMYIHGRILTDSIATKALPDEAIIEEGGANYIFTATKNSQQDEDAWIFQPIKIRTGTQYKGWTEIKLLEPLPKGSKVAWNNAYYLVSEMKKSQASHSH